MSTTPPDWYPPPPGQPPKQPPTPAATDTADVAIPDSTQEQPEPIDVPDENTDL